MPSSTVGGTIMSYCHLTSSTIKFANGFGPQPTAVMVNKINTAACLTTCGTTCGTPSGLAASNITTTSATLAWASASGATSYTLQWRPASVSTWTTVSNLTATSHSLANLTENTTYNFQVMATCASGISAYAPMASFTTATTGTTCGIPNGLSAPELTTTTAVLVWNGVMDALSYDLQWKASSANTWNTVAQVTTTNHTLTGLTPGTAYQFKVMTNCTGTTSAFSGNATFNTLEDGCTDSYEPNNALNQASVVGSGVTVYAKIANGSDQDHFKFGNAKKTKNIRVTLTDLPADFDIYLFRNNGEVASSTNVGSLGEEIVLNNASVSSNYRVRVVGKNGAFDASACYTLTIEVSGNTFSTQGTLYDGMVAGIEDPFAELVVYPNPASQQLNIQVPAVEGLIGIDLLDGTGRLVRNQQVTATDGAPTILSLDVLDLPQGLYFIRVTVGDANEVRRVVIAH